MSTGLYQDHFVAERFLASVSATTIAQRYVVPADADVLGLILWLGTPAGGTSGVNVNVSNSPTSQTGGGGTTVGAYNLWTTANVPTVTGTATTNLSVSQSSTFFGAQSLVQNQPYALNYPLPGPSGTTGFVTAQSTSQTTETPVTSPPVIFRYGINFPSAAGTAFFAPDNTYTDYNGVTATAASLVHQGDVLSFVITAGGSGVSLGSAANLNCELVMSKR